MNDVERLIAIEEIKRLKATYFRVGDAQDIAAMPPLYVDDCELDYRGSCKDPVSGVNWMPGVTEEKIHGLEAAMAAFSTGGALQASVHQGYNPEIDIIDDANATGVWGMTDRLFFKSDFPIAQLTGYGHYHETYRKVDGTWKFATIRLTRIRVEVVERG